MESNILILIIIFKLFKNKFTFLHLINYVNKIKITKSN